MYYLILLFTLLSLFGITQENPWLTPNEKNPWVEKDTVTHPIVIKKENKESITFPKSIQIVKDTFSNSNPIVNNSIEKDSIENEKFLIDYYSKLGESELKSNGSTVFGALTCTIFNVFGVFPALITVAAPNELQLNAAEHLKSKYPNITKKQIRAYKNGVINKRVKKTLKGCLIGTAINITVIISLILFNF